MNTNINDIQDRYTADRVVYDNSNLANLLAEAKAAKTLIETRIPTHITQMESQDKLWKGKAKKEYLGLKDLLKQYQGDFADAVAELETTIAGLETLLNSTSEAKVIKEIEQG